MNRSFLSPVTCMLLLACTAKVSENTTTDSISFASSTVVEAVEKDFLLGKVNPSTDSRFVKIADEFASGSAKGGYLLKETYEAFIKMAKDAKQSGLTLKIVAATRSFDDQKPIWESKWSGKVQAGSIDKKKITNPKEKAKTILRVSSMPGTSRYHWGTDIAINSMDEDYFLKSEGEEIYRWLTSQATNYGFCQPYSSKINGRSGYEEAKWQWSYRPKSELFLKQYLAQVKYEDINGFAGSEVAADVKIIGQYVGGVECLKFESFTVEMDKQGMKVNDEIVISAEDYIEILSYSEGLIAVKRESGWGFANLEGKLVIPCRYAGAGWFVNGKAPVYAPVESWRDQFYYIDIRGNEVGKFFEPFMGPAACKRENLVGSNLSGESMATYNLSNCPDGTMIFEDHGWEWGSSTTYYANTDIESVINGKAQAEGEYSAVFKKFKGQSDEFKEGERNITITVTPNIDGSLNQVDISISSEFSGASFKFSEDDNGVLVVYSYGS